MEITKPLKIRLCASVGGRNDYLLRKPKLSPEASFELQPTKRQKRSFHLRLPSNCSRQNVKNTAFTADFFRIAADRTSKTPLYLRKKAQLSPEASFELQLRLPSNYRRPKRQTHSFHLQLPSIYSSKPPSDYSRQNPKTQLSPEASWDLQYEASTSALTKRQKHSFCLRLHLNYRQNTAVV